MQEAESFGAEFEQINFNGLRIVDDLEAYGKASPNHGVSLGYTEIFKMDIPDSEFVCNFIIDKNSGNDALMLIRKLVCGEEVSIEDKRFLAKKLDDFKLRISTSQH